MTEQFEGSARIIDASKWERFFNFIIDYIAVMIIGVIIVILIEILFGAESVEYIMSYPDMFIGTVLMLIYYVAFEGITGRTIGKYITGTKVATESGGDPSFKQILGRSFCRFIPFEPLSFFGALGNGWHDSIPNTSVIKCR